ncbi:MAG: flagellar hook-basal body complex protein, partial [Peptococcaceae bacterium]|nr:flagellar hook-basal body complex protein [Peptococcaceae bacterium]
GITIGLGSMLGSVDKVMGQGSSQYTGKKTDIMIQGEGYFVLDTEAGLVYTRVGNFDFDKDGNLVNVGTGAIVQGYQYDDAGGSWGTTLTGIKFSLGSLLDPTADPDDPATYKLQSFSIGQDGVITGVYSNETDSLTRPMFKIALAIFSNPSGLTPIGNNFYLVSNNSGDADIGDAGIGWRGKIMPNYLEMSNVDLSQEFTDMIVTQRGFQANARVITVSDTLLQELVDLKR